MKKICIVFTAITLLVMGSVQANEANNINPTKNLAVQIQKLLEGNTLKVEGRELTGQVRFTINKEEEIVVLSVDTDSTPLEGFVKGRLNYQKVDFDNVKEGKIYQIPIRVLAK